MQTMRDAAAGTAPATHTIVASPLGDLTVVSRAGAITGLYFPNHGRRPDPRSFGETCDVGFDEVGRELSEYFAGQRRRFTVPSQRAVTGCSGGSGIWSAGFPTARPRPTAGWPPSWETERPPRRSAPPWAETRCVF